MSSYSPLTVGQIISVSKARQIGLIPPASSQSLRHLDTQIPLATASPVITRRKLIQNLVIAGLGVSALGRGAFAGQGKEIVVDPGSSVQDAINEAKPGDTVRLLPGVYSVESTNTLRLKTGVRLVGSGKDKTFYIQQPPEFGRQFRAAVVGRDAHNVTIEDMTISGDTYALSLQYSNNFRIRNSRVIAPFVPLHLLHVEDSLFTGSEFISTSQIPADKQTAGFDTAIVMWNSSRNKIRGSLIKGVLDLHGSSDNVFKRVVIYRSPKGKLYPYPRIISFVNGSRRNLVTFSTLYAPYDPYHNYPRDKEYHSRALVQASTSSSQNTILNSILASGNERVARAFAEGGFQQSGVTIANSLVDQKLVFGKARIGRGVLFGDPLFFKPKKGNFRLLPGSPAIGAAGNGMDMGAIRFRPRLSQLIADELSEFTPLEGLEEMFEGAGRVLVFPAGYRYHQGMPVGPNGETGIISGIGSGETDVIIENEIGVEQASSPVGGINLNPALMDLQIKRDGKGVPLPFNLQPLEIMDIEGFIPVIINVTPVINLPMLLGWADTEADTDEPIFNTQLGPMDTQDAYRARQLEKLSFLN